MNHSHLSMRAMRAIALGGPAPLAGEVLRSGPDPVFEVEPIVPR